MSDSTEVSPTKAIAKVNRRGFPISGILTIIFVVGKILGKITWSWLWVLAPFWGPYVASFILITMLALIVGRKHEG